MPNSIDWATRRALDDAYFGLRQQPDGTIVATISEHLARYDRRMFGGTAAAIAVATVEAVTERDALWVTAQFVSSVERDTDISVAAEVVASGRRVSQVRLTATAEDGRIVFTGVGAAADASDDAPAGQAARMPAVRDPDESVTMLVSEDLGDVGWHTEVNVRLAAAGIGDEPHRMALWLRFRDGKPLTAARLAFGADMVPITLARACGVTSGVSLDNTIRIVQLVDTEWVLLDLHPHGASRGYGAGSVLLWAQDGTLLGSASQSSSIFAHENDFFSAAIEALRQG